MELTRHKAGRYLVVALGEKRFPDRGQPRRKHIKLKNRVEDPAFTSAEWARRKRRRKIAAASRARNRR